MADTTVTVRKPGESTDAELAKAAGYNPLRHFGFDVTRYDDGAAIVALWNS